jgi:hypothetical protein
MQDVKTGREKLSVDRSVEITLLGLCLAASIYGLSHLGAGPVPT